MTAAGLGSDTAMMLLARHRSEVKYGYPLSQMTLFHLLGLSRKPKIHESLSRLVRSPLFLTKACWVYEHAPYFFFYDQRGSEDCDALIEKFAEHYERLLLNNRVSFSDCKRRGKPRRVRATTFWESKTFDPLVLIRKAMRDGLEGLELSIDFHPFNYTTLLPEEIEPLRRARIRDLCMRSEVKVDLHSPVVGPYTPVPDPSKGKQRFFDPARCLGVQMETIELAKDIGAGCVVVHLIDASELKAITALIEQAGGSEVRVVIENYYQTRERQTSEVFIDCAHEIYRTLPREVRERNFGLNLDVGHFNIEGEDPLIAAEKVGRWCLGNKVFLRLHATDNYGELLFSPPAHSADVHSNVSGRGINNRMIIRMLRSMGHELEVVAEQIQPLTPEDIATIHEAQTCPIEHPYEELVKRGENELSAIEPGALIEAHVTNEKAYRFLVGMKGISALREHLVYRKIQDKKHLSVEEAKRISQDFMKVPEKFKKDLTTYIDELLLPIQTETGSVQKIELDLICQNISGALFATLNNEHLDRIFYENRLYQEGDIICEQDKPGQEMYFVKQGEVAAYIDENLVASLGPGEILGEISLFYNVNRSATIKASKRDTKVGLLSRKGLETLFRSGQPYARDLIWRLYRILPDRLRNLNDKYKAAMRALHLLFDGDEESILPVDRMEMEIQSEKLNFFATLSHRDVSTIYQEVRGFDTGEIIFGEGDQADGAYFILAGQVKAVAACPNSREILLGKLGAGETFGEMALVDEKLRSATVTALSPCKTAFINKDAFNEFIETRSELAFRLMGFISMFLFKRILRLDKVYSDMKKNLGQG